MKRLLLIIALLVIATPWALGQQKPNFSGVWRRTQGQELLTIEHREPKLHLVYWIKDFNGERTLDLTTLTDGKEHKQTVLSHPASVVMRWEGAGLLWEIKRNTATGQVHNRRMLQLAADGQSITGARVDFNPDGTEARRLTETWAKTTPPAPKSAADSKAVQELQQFANELIAAFARNDAAALERLYADDFIGTTLMGEVYDKPGLLGVIKSGIQKYESVKVDEIKLHVYGDAATVHSRARIKLRINGQPKEDFNRATTTLVKRRGQWRIVADHTSPIAKQ